MAQRNGTGMFPRVVRNWSPLLPLEEGGRLNDMPLVENFMGSAFACYRWTETLEREPAPGGLVQFHSAHKLTLIVPLTMLKHHLNRYPVPHWLPVPSAAWVPQQVYLHPYLKELMLRNHVWQLAVCCA